MKSKQAEVEPIFVRPAQMAVMLQICRAKAYQLIANGTIRSVRIGGALRVPLAAIRDLARIDEVK